MILSGANCFITSFNAMPKSPTKVQHIHPEFISVICMPESFKNPPSIPISPNSFSIRTIFSPLKASAISFLIRVVLPAPRNPEKMSTFVISITLPYFAVFLSFLYIYVILMTQNMHCKSKARYTIALLILKVKYSIAPI